MQRGMSPLLRTSFLVHACLVNHVFAGWGGNTLDLAVQQARATTGGDSLICGSKSIAESLSGTQEEELRNTPWDWFTTIIDDFLSTSLADKVELTRQVKSIENRREANLKADKAEALSADTLGKLIESAIKEGFTTLEEATRSRCGEQIDGALTSDPYEESLQAFKTKAEDEIGKRYTVTKKQVTETCNGMLGKAGNDCTELCISFAAIASRHSASITLTSNMFEQELAKAKRELAAVESAILKCTQSQQTLQEFKMQISPLQDDISVKYTTYRRMRRLVSAAQLTAFDSGIKVKVSESAAAKALELMQGKQANAIAAVDLLQQSRSAEETLKQELEQVNGRLAEAARELGEVVSADTILSELRIAVSLTMHKMSTYIDSVVREPLKNVGLDDTTDIDAKFQEGAATLPAATTVKQSLSSLEDYCKITAMPAFEHVNKSVDLTPLCDAGPVAGNLEGITLAVDSRRKKLAADLKAVQSWLNPYKGQTNMDTAKDLSYQKQGEPAGLRTITSVFHKTSYYMSYLKRWKVTEPNGFLTLYKKLNQTLKSAKAAHARLEQDVARLQTAIRAATNKSSEALVACEVAAKELEDASESKRAEQAKLDALRKEAAALSSTLNELDGRMKAALAAYEEALRLLQSSFEAGIQNIMSNDGPLALPAKGRDISSTIS